MAESTDTGVENVKTEWKLEIPGICHYNVSSNATDDIVRKRLCYILLYCYLNKSRNRLGASSANIKEVIFTLSSEDKSFLQDYNLIRVVPVR